MRIGYLYDFKTHPPRGGNHVHAIELTQGFLQCGHSVSVVDDPTMPSVSNFGSSPSELEEFIRAIELLYVRIDARFTRKWNALKMCTGSAGIRPIVWEINSPASEGLAYSWLGGRSLGAFGRETVVRRLRRGSHATRQLPGIWLEERHRRSLAKSVSSAVCVSTPLGRYAREELGINDVLVLPNGGPILSQEQIQRRRERRKYQGFIVFYSGSAIYPWQGLDLLYEVIALARRSAPDVTFVLAVNQRTAQLLTSDNVIILEHLDRDQILDAICAADACVSLHPEYSWSKYGFHNSPMKLFEYMACMRPVVASDHGQMHEIIRNGQDGLLCANEAMDIFNKLLLLRDNPARAACIGRKGWERIHSNFNWQRNVEETLKLFERNLLRRA